MTATYNNNCQKSTADIGIDINLPQLTKGLLYINNLILGRSNSQQHGREISKIFTFNYA
jgi:hypothetical protein